MKGIPDCFQASNILNSIYRKEKERENRRKRIEESLIKVLRCPPTILACGNSTAPLMDNSPTYKLLSYGP